MSLGIGLIISKNVDLDIINSIKEKYELGLFKIENKYVYNQLLEDEMFLQATLTGCDSLTGIGSYEIYTKDVSKIYENVKNKKEAKFLADDFIKRKESYVNDVLQWINIIKEFKVNKFGMFIHFYTTSFDKEKITFQRREKCDMNNITLDYIMKIQKDVIVFID